MKKTLLALLALSLLVVGSATADNKPQPPKPQPPAPQQHAKATTYRVYLDVGHGKDEGTDDPVFITFVSEGPAREYQLDNPGKDDNNGGMSVFTVKVDGLRGEITKIRLTVKKGNDNKIDDIFVRSIKIENLDDHSSTGDIRVNQWIGDGKDARISFSCPVRWMKR